MSDDPFGKGDRTVIRPNPGGRLPQAPQPAQPSMPANAPQPMQPMQPQRAVSSPWDDWTSAASRAPAHEVNPYQPPLSERPRLTRRRRSRPTFQPIW